MGRAEREHDKWTKPGWKIEKRYSNKVLIGNWAEDKLQFTRDYQTPDSTSMYRQDYRLHKDHQPDVIVRRHAVRRAEGLPSRLLLAHHGVPRTHCLVSLYNETYSRGTNPTTPALRTWHPIRPAWVPERSDHPVESPPMNFGLAELHRTRWGQEQERCGLPAVSMYCSAYVRYPPSAFLQPRFSHMPREHACGCNIPTKIGGERGPAGPLCRQVEVNSTNVLPALPQV